MLQLLMLTKIDPLYLKFWSFNRANVTNVLSHILSFIIQLSQGLEGINDYSVNDVKHHQNNGKEEEPVKEKLNPVPGVGNWLSFEANSSSAPYRVIQYSQEAMKKRVAGIFL